MSLKSALIPPCTCAFSKRGSMTDRKPTEDVEQLISKFKSLVSEVDAIRQKMKELAKQIEARTGQSTGMKSSHEITTTDTENAN